MYLVKTPKFIRALFPNYIWRIPTSEKAIYLTFDDGPTPEVTPWVLTQLKEYDAHATFFCVGENINRHPELLDSLIHSGHSVGNHTYNHLNAWKTDMATYLKNVRRCARLVPTTLFRPPYGKLLPQQNTFLRRHYQIVMWDVLSGDFDENNSAETCLHNVIDNSEPGSIILFHDSKKAWPRLEKVLPEVLDRFTKAGYKFKALRSLLPYHVAHGRQSILL